MNKILSIAFLCCIVINSAYAKKVKFMVNMTGQVLSPMGIHVMGDFQAIAGLGADWSPNTATMTKDITDTNLYYLVVDIPAKNKYEYKYVNGDQSYEVEIVPEKAQVGYNFVDNRWFFLDSLANDTTILPAVVFNESSPVGKTLMRFVVDMTLQTVSPNGVHVAGNFQGWNTNNNILYSFVAGVYETIIYENAGSTYEYKFYNGNTGASAETVPNACATNNNRAISLTTDSIITKVCFASCNTCFPTAVNNFNNNDIISVYPNPAQDLMNIQLATNYRETYSLQIKDLTGRTIKTIHQINDAIYQLSVKDLAPAFYLLQIKSNTGNTYTQKIKVQ